MPSARQVLRAIRSVTGFQNTFCFHKVVDFVKQLYDHLFTDAAFFAGLEDAPTRAVSSMTLTAFSFLGAFAFFFLGEPLVSP